MSLSLFQALAGRLSASFFAKFDIVIGLSLGVADQHQRGEAGEALVAHYLAEQGWQIVTQRWRCRWGELDVVAHRDGVTAFVEVKTRSRAFSDAVQAVTPTKQARLIKAAQCFLQAEPSYGEGDCRFDVAVVMGRSQLQLVQYLEAAFMA